MTTALARYCGKRSRAGTPCRRPAGWGTNHAGEGPCKLHGGATPIKSGRYSKITRERVRDLIEQYEADPDPLNLLAELAAARALFTDFIERYDEWSDALLAWHESWGEGEGGGGGRPRQILDLSDAIRHLDVISKIVERIEKVRAANAISRRDLLRIMTEMGNVVQLCNHEPDEAKRLEAIHDGWKRIALA